MEDNKTTVETVEKEDFFESLFNDDEDENGEDNTAADRNGGNEEDPDDEGDGTEGNGADKTPDYKTLYEELKNSSEREKSKLNEAAKALGYKDADHLFADSQGKTVDDYKKSEADELTVSEAKKIVERAKMEKVIAEDISTLKAKGYIGEEVTSISQIPNVKRFAELRDKGLSAEEAFRAVNGDEIEAKTERRAQVIAAGKTHLRSTAQRAVSGSVPQMSSEERAEYKELLGIDDDKAVETYWKRAHGIK